MCVCVCVCVCLCVRVCVHVMIPLHIYAFTLTGWWFVSNGVDEGWAPCSYLESIDGIDEEEVAVSSLGMQRHESVCLRGSRTSKE